MPPAPGSPTIDASGTGTLTGTTRLGNGSFKSGFTNYTGTSYMELASTNVTLPINLRSNLDTSVGPAIGSGKFEFTDPQATDSPQRFYRVHPP